MDELEFEKRSKWAKNMVDLKAPEINLDSFVLVSLTATIFSVLGGVFVLWMQTVEEVDGKPIMLGGFLTAAGCYLYKASYDWWRERIFRREFDNAPIPKEKN